MTGAHRHMLVIATTALMVAMSACGPSGTPDIRVSDAQAGEPRAGASQVVVTVTNAGDGDDRLTGVSTSSALGVEIHLTEIVDQRATMRQVDEVDLPAGEQIRFRPGGLHLMLVVPDDSVVAGAAFSMTMHFERSDDVVVEVDVVDLLDMSERALEQEAEQ